MNPYTRVALLNGEFTEVLYASLHIAYQPRDKTAPVQTFKRYLTDPDEQEFPDIVEPIRHFSTSPSCRHRIAVIEVADAARQILNIVDRLLLRKTDPDGRQNHLPVESHRR